MSPTPPATPPSTTPVSAKPTVQPTSGPRCSRHASVTGPVNRGPAVAGPLPAASRPDPRSRRPCSTAATATSPAVAATTGPSIHQASSAYGRSRSTQPNGDTPLSQPSGPPV
ncbi:hypothetical protein [Solwaraspora sp. WMMA2101]|uniref:hypothetical protein n=1 Tax=Solwaraspora sp. WMMA2101 TaxID=3404124 RepID=UPI003B927CAE